MASAICLTIVRLPALSWRYVAHPGARSATGERRHARRVFYFDSFRDFPAALGVRLGWGWRVEFFSRN
jgi:hypothetical protein